MNCLNSVLLEGRINSDPVETKFSNGTSQVQFEFRSTRVLKVEDGDVETKDIVVDVLVMGARLQRIVMDALKKGSLIRLVGSLDSDRSDSDYEGKRLWIRAEHIEYKPVRAKKVTEHENENK